MRLGGVYETRGDLGPYLTTRYAKVFGGMITPLARRTLIYLKRAKPNQRNRFPLGKYAADHLNQ